MAYILDGMTIAQEGGLAATPSGSFCIQPFALVTQGIVVFPVVDEGVTPVAPSAPHWPAAVHRENERRTFMAIYAFVRLREWH